MKFRIFMATATAASVLMTVGVMAASNNAATIKQDGDDNTATITQTGNENDVGSPLVGATSPYGKVVQTGDDNKISILQDGSNNNIAQWAGGSSNVKQDGDLNELDVKQYSGTGKGNAIHNIDQDSDPNSAFAANKLTILQGSDTQRTRHVVGSVVQKSLEADDALDLNVISISQVGPAGTRPANIIRSVSQEGSASSLILNQTGLNNFVDVASQDGTGNEATVKQNGSQNTVALLSQDVAGSSVGGNHAYVELNGDLNGTGASGFVKENVNEGWSISSNAYLVHEAFSGSVGAAIAGLDQAKVVQEGGGNLLSYIVTIGNRNLFGFKQDGDGNDINGTVTGDDNQVAVLTQGDTNEVDFLQTGSKNTAGAKITASGNRLNLKQEQSGGLVGNDISVTITGDSNGKGSFGTSNAMTSLATANGLSSGDIFQSNDDNSVTLNVLSASNDFAFRQTGGNGNTITANVSVGDSNNAVGVQNGSSNTATLTQAGAANNALFNQIGAGNTTTITQ